MNHSKHDSSRQRARPYVIVRNGRVYSAATEGELPALLKRAKARGSKVELYCNGKLIEEPENA